MSVLFAIQPDGLSAPEWYLARTPGEVELIPADLIETVQADRIVWLVAGTDVFLSEIEAAARSVEELRTAGLYQLEDELSQPVSSQHLALGPKDPVKPGARHAAVISLNRLSEILDQLSDYSEEFASRVELIPETSLITGSGGSVIYDGDDRLLVSNGIAPALAIEPKLASILLPALLHQLDVTEIDVYESSQPVVPQAPLPAELILNAAGQISYPRFISSPLLDGAGINLRQGRFAPKRKMKIGISGWTGTFALAGLALAVWLGSLGLSVVQLNSETDRLYDEMRSAYAAAFPREGDVLDPRRAVVSKLQGAGAGSGMPSFIELASAFYTGVRSVEGVELDGFSYDRSTGRLTATLRFSGYQDRDALKQTFDRQGIPIQLGGARQENGMLVGEAILGGAIS